jgi:hypothetical protein
MLPLLHYAIVVENFSDIAAQRPCYSLILTMLYVLEKVYPDYYIVWIYSIRNVDSFCIVCLPFYQ